MTNEAKTAKMETIAVETSLEEPPAVPPEKIRIPKIRLGSNKIYVWLKFITKYYSRSKENTFISLSMI